VVFLEWLEAIFGVLFLLFVITQVLIPLARGLPFFPAFRKSTEKLEEDLEQAKEEVEKAKLESMLAEEKLKAEKIRKTIKPQTKVKEKEKSDGQV
jgi:argininosuccinate lyase